MATAAEVAAAVPPTVVQLTGRSLHLMLCKAVTNAPDVRAALLTESKKRDMAVLNASMVAGLFHVQLAAFKALEAEAEGKLTTKTLHSELVYSMAGTNHVGESLKRCGIHDDTKHVLVALFDATTQDIEDVRSLVHGTPVPLTQLAELQEAEAMQQAYKVTADELKVGSLEDAVVAKLAAKEC